MTKSIVSPTQQKHMPNGWALLRHVVGHLAIQHQPETARLLPNCDSRGNLHSAHGLALRSSNAMETRNLHQRQARWKTISHARLGPKRSLLENCARLRPNACFWQNRALIR